MLFVAFLAAYSRVYIGVHYPLDSICGSLIGVLFFFITYKTLQKIDGTITGD